MRLAATLKPGRGAIRRGIGFTGTMRGAGGRSCDIAILDISATGCLAELPGGMTLDPGTTVRIAAAALGRQPAIVVRREGRRHGFAFAQPLDAHIVATIDPAAGGVAPRGAPAPSGHAVLAIAAIAGAASWTTLTSLLILAAR